MGCEEPIETAFPGDATRPGDRGTYRILHRVGSTLTWRCPRALAQEPIAIEAWDAYLWWDKGQSLEQLTAPYPVPALLLDSVRIIRGEYHRAHDAYWRRHHPDAGG
jgi:hypothetical protein